MGRKVQYGEIGRPNKADGATLDDIREAVATLEDFAPAARRVYGGGHPLASAIEDELQDTRAALRSA